MNRYQFEVLTYIEKNGKKEYPMRTLSDTLKISGTAISKALDELENEALIKDVKIRWRLLKEVWRHLSLTE